MFIRLFYTLVVPVIIMITAITVIVIARGYRLDVKTKELQPTGILVATSEPDGAQVFINGKFSAATNSNINLTPDRYEVKLVKEGYHQWQRELRIQGEVVVKTDAVLFLKNPSLAPLTATGVEGPLLSPDGTKIAYIASPSATISRGQSIFEEQLRQPTLFIYDLLGRGLPFSRNPAPYQGTLAELLSEWELEEKTVREVALRKMPAVFTAIATNSARILSFSPDETKVLYEATAGAALERVIMPPLIGTSTHDDIREVEPGWIYTYDAKEDRNYKIAQMVQFDRIKDTQKVSEGINNTMPAQVAFPIQWLGTSSHLVVIKDKTIVVMEYDGGNSLTVYSGPFENGYVFPHPSGKQLIIMTTFNPESAPIPSLYTLSIR